MRRILIFYILFLSVGTFSVHAQSVKSLKKEQEKAKKQIELTNKLLKETQQTKKSTVSNLSILKKQISERENLILSINSELGAIDSDLSNLNQEKEMLQNRLDELKKEYAELVRRSYFSKSKYNEFLFIFSAESFTQAYRRMRYIQEYSTYRKEQAIHIQKVSTDLAQKQQELEEVKTEKSVVLKNKEKENQKLEQDKNSKERMLTDLQKKEKELRSKLKKEQKKATDLNKKIDNLIAKEIAEAERKAKLKREQQAKAAAAKKGSSSQSKPATGKPTVGSSLTKEEGLIAGGFEKNKGRLPSPAKGVIIGHFGVQKHAVLKHVEINNKGIYIQTAPNSDACAVYDGEVTQVFAIPGSNNAVIVKHGNYRTVYANLTTTYVKVGAKVKSKDKIGKIFVDSENDNKTVLYFMIYKNSDLENPETWISK